MLVHLCYSLSHNLLDVPRDTGKMFYFQSPPRSLKLHHEEDVI
jgi:hypothetical protein